MILFLHILYQFINKLHLSFFEKQIKETNIFHSIKNSHVFFYTFAHKICGTSAIQANLIAFSLHNLCIRLAASQQLKRASLRSACMIFVVRIR